MKKKRKIIIAALILPALIWMLIDSFTQTGVKNLKGNFKELAFIRNEQNTGPVLRIYSASVNDTLWQEMNAYGDYMPHTKYGITRVYFFLENSPAPKQLRIDKDNMDSYYKKYCIAKFEKDAMGQTSLRKFPFSK